MLCHLDDVGARVTRLLPIDWIGGNFTRNHGVLQPDICDIWVSGCIGYPAKKTQTSSNILKPNLGWFQSIDWLAQLYLELPLYHCWQPHFTIGETRKTIHRISMLWLLRVLYDQKLRMKPSDPAVGPRISPESRETHRRRSLTVTNGRGQIRSNLGSVGSNLSKIS